MSNSALKLLAGAGAKDSPVYVDDVFQTTLYKGTLNTYPNNVVNGMDFDDKGGLLWIKNRDQSDSHFLFDTVRGDHKRLYANLTNGESDLTAQVALAFNSDGFSVGDVHQINAGNENFVAWNFLQQEKFFDIVTYSGTGSAQNISHNLGSVPGFIWVKRYSGTEDWICYHRSLGNTSGIALNQSNAAYTSVSAFWDSTTPTDSVFTVGTHDRVNTNGHTYVAYLFAHNEADFGTDSDEAIIHCGTYTGNGTSSTSTQHIDLGFEPQFFIVKVTTMSGQEWFMYDTMRGLVGRADADGDMRLMPSADSSEYQYLVGHPTPTGLQLIGNENEVNKNGETYVYMAIRRPHKPASEFAGTDLFKVEDPSGSTPTFNAGFTVDFILNGYSTGTAGNAFTRLTGNTRQLQTHSTSAETSGGGTAITFDQQLGIGEWTGGAGSTYLSWMFRRAPGFFDVVLYTGTGSDLTVSHNLGATPELIIVKNRTRSEGWPVYHSADSSDYFFLNASTEGQSNNRFSSITASSFVAEGGSNDVNSTYGDSHIAFLFASVTGISKTGAYTGTGSDLNVDCGFSAGARFVLIKRSNGSGDWYYWDHHRGIVAGDDPYALLNSSAASVTNTDYIDPLNAGFTVTSSAPAGLNNSGSTYIFLAIA